MVKHQAKSIKEIWKIYQNYDYMGSEESYVYRGYLFKDGGYSGSVEMFNISTGKSVEHFDANRMSYEKFSNAVKQIIKLRAKSTQDYFDKLEKMGK
ncbi:MAG: hypothetical protein KKF56_05040 [Nanoarchaeota archaeon]|nr:hypothetical protein [Nanoarchaeota archaeon]